MVFDVAIVGGSFAGMSAALQLARARRRVAVFDSGLRRNRFATSSHGFLAQDGRAPAAIVADVRMLASRGVKVEATPVAAIVDDARVVMVDGRGETFAGIFTASRTAPASPLAAQLGCEHDEGLQGPFVRTDAMKATSVPGVFGCGDAARAAGNVALAVGEGALAGMAVHASLVFHA